MAIFSTAEIERRHAGLRARMGDAEAVLACSFLGSYYLSGVPIIPWGRPTVTVLPREGAPALVIAAIEAERAGLHSPISDMRTYADLDGPNAAVAARLAADILKPRGLRRIAFDGRLTTAGMLALLQAEMPDAVFTDISDALEDLMLVSSAEEIELIRAATAIADRGIAAFIGEARIGVPEVVIAGRAMLAMSEHAATAYESVETKVNCYSQQGLRSLQAHTGASGEPLRPGQLVTVVVEVYAWNYQVAIERALLTGEPTDAQRQYYEAMAAAHRAAIDATRPGASFADVDRAARDIMVAAGYEGMHCGTGLVRGLVTEWEGRIDRGNLRPYNDRRLEPGMVLTIEPWAIAPGVGGSRHCDVVRVTDDGHEVISTLPDGMIFVG